MIHNFLLNKSGPLFILIPIHLFDDNKNIDKYVDKDE